MMNIYVYGEVESEEHVLLDCNLYMYVKRRWTEKLALVNVDVYNAILLLSCHQTAFFPLSTHFLAFSLNF